MIEPFQWVAGAGSLAFLILVIDLARRRKLTEEYAFLWIVCALALMVFSAWRGLLHTVALWLDIQYPPAVLLLVLGFFVLAESLWFTVIVSRQRLQIERLIEDVAILAARAREDRAPREKVEEPPRASGAD